MKTEKLNNSQEAQDSADQNPIEQLIEDPAQSEEDRALAEKN